jgi:ankyrin repeat protein
MLAILMLLLGATPLSYAIFGCGSTSVVRFLLDRGAKPNKANINGVTALHYAAIPGSFLPLHMFVSVFIACSFVHLA